MVAARSPRKPVLGIRIPLLRSAVRSGLKESGVKGPVNGLPVGDAERVLSAAHDLWHGAAHEEELAACMLLRLSTLPIPVATVREWAPLLDNWLSVDELGGCVGATLVGHGVGVSAAGMGVLRELGVLSASPSPWQRRLYVVSMIAPLRCGLAPDAVPDLGELIIDPRKPVRMACAWLLRDVVKHRPEAAEQFRAMWPQAAPAALTRLVQPGGSS